MTTETLLRTNPFSAKRLEIDPEAETARIVEKLRTQLGSELRKRGLVLGLSGGLDSSVCAGLAARAVGAKNVFCIFMPEHDSDPESLRLGREAAAAFGLTGEVEDIGPMLEGLGCYSRREAFIREVAPEYGPGWLSKIVIANSLTSGGYNLSSLVARSPKGEQKTVRLPLRAYQGIVAATNMKQRTRKQIEYYHADRLNYAVVGTPNRPIRASL
jgi:NAD+ synthase